MKKQEFINELRKALATLPAGEREDILRDQEEFLLEEELAGRIEEEVIRSLGDPKKLANRLNAEAKITAATRSHSLRAQISRTFAAVLAILALAPLNLIFVFWPYLILTLLNLAAWLMAGGTTLFALASLFVFCFKLIFIKVGFWTHISAFFFITGWIATGLLLIWIMVKLTRLEMKVTLNYLKWNLRMISGKI